MVTIKIIKNTEADSNESKNPNIRRYFDGKSGKWYYSIVDVIGILTSSTDARNYWKVLKNRLKKTQNELVTKCNQLKMKAKDGKYYLTDTADAETMIEIIEAIPKASVGAFKELVKDIEEGKIAGNDSPNQIKLTEDKPLDEEEKVEPEAIPKVDEENSNAEAELLVDAYQTASEIFIIAMLAGVEENSLQINLQNIKITISGEKKKPEKANGEYLCEELVWTTFSRTLSLPSLVQADNIEKIFENGKLIIRLIKIIN